MGRHEGVRVCVAGAARRTVWHEGDQEEAERVAGQVADSPAQIRGIARHSRRTRGAQETIGGVEDEGVSDAAANGRQYSVEEFT